jgi:AraC-like DNA-binding protein
VLYLTRPEFEIRPIHSLHLLPVILSAIYFSITVYLQPADVKIDIYQSMMNPVEFKDYFWGLSHIIVNIPYLIAAARILQKHKTRIQQTFSYMEKINLQWLQFLIIGFITVFALNTVFDFMYIWHIYEGFGGPAMGVIATILIYTIGYKGLRQPEIFTSEVEPPKNSSETRNEVSLEQIEKLSAQIQKVMQREKPYLDPSLTIRDLANRANIPDYRLSQVINDYFEKNFFEFVNRYRIEEAKQRLQDPNYENFTILAIANDVGFNSKSSFNTAFKRFTQKTPSSYRKSLD